MAVLLESGQLRSDHALSGKSPLPLAPATRNALQSSAPHNLQSAQRRTRSARRHPFRGDGGVRGFAPAPRGTGDSQHALQPRIPRRGPRRLSPTPVRSTGSPRPSVERTCGDGVGEDGAPPGRVACPSECRRVAAIACGRLHRWTRAARAPPSRNRHASSNAS